MKWVPGASPGYSKGCQCIHMTNLLPSCAACLVLGAVTSWSPKVLPRDSLPYTRCFIMFSMITNIYNKKTKEPTLMEFFTATGKLKKYFLTTRDVRCVHHGWHGTHRYDVCRVTMPFLPHTRQHVDMCVARTWISYWCVPRHPWCAHRTSLVVKKNFFDFPVAVNSSINVGPLVFLLQMFVIMENIMKRPVFVLNCTVCYVQKTNLHATILT